ncbi:hypothetical protein [Nostoc sp. C117]|uniref:hypothetical protein n=1 Tax=Nostoc sp. C117 TaxID=3349875 RepID=UPI00370D1CF9
MIRRFSSIIDSVMHCQPQKGSGKKLALSAFEGNYRFLGAKSASESILKAIALWLNPDRLVQSGRCKCVTAPKIRQKVSTT